MASFVLMGFGPGTTPTLFTMLGFGTGGKPIPPTPPPAPQQSSGGLPEYGRRRTRKELAEDRKRFGIIEPQALEVIAEVAARQADRLELDRQKQFDELARELQIQRIEWQAGMLEALAEERSRLIDAEIGKRLREQAILRQNENEIMMLTLIAAAAALY